MRALVARPNTATALTPTRSALLCCCMALNYDEKLSLVRMGLAVPGMDAEGKQVSRDLSSRLEASGVFELGAQRPVPAADAPRRCTREEPCDLDAADVLRSLLLVPLPLLLAGFAVAAGRSAYVSEDDDAFLARLEKQAERSRERRLARQRDLASRIAPLQEWFGWSLVTGDGLPTGDAYVALAVAVLAQVALAFALAAPLNDAFAPG